MARSQGMATAFPSGLTYTASTLQHYVTYEGTMAHQIVCPFYGKSDDHCDVGCGYISPYDVNLIIRYCSRCYKECLKYQELAERFPGENLTMIKC